MPKHSIFKSFVFAFQGFRSAFSERNFVIHITIAILVLMAGFFFHVTTMEWCILMICIGMVMAAELFNTAIEKLVDMVSPGFSPKAGEIKDISAAAVLLLAIVAAIAGLVIFVPYVLD